MAAAAATVSASTSTSTELSSEEKKQRLKQKGPPPKRPGSLAYTSNSLVSGACSRREALLCVCV